MYLHWVLQAVGAPSAVFRGYAHHYLTSAISLLEDRTDDGPRDAAKGRAQGWQADIEFLRSLLSTYLDMPVHLIAETAYPAPSRPTAPPAPESLPLTPQPEGPSAPRAGEGAPSGAGPEILQRRRGPVGGAPNPPVGRPTGRAARLIRRIRGQL